MKRITLTLLSLLFAVTGILAQTPNQFKYQAVLRDATGNILADEAVTVDISILQSSADGTSVFSESHSVTTTSSGIINLSIGSVNTVDMAKIAWGTDSYFVSMSVNGTEMGTSQLLSVPFALYAANSGSSTAGPAGAKGDKGDIGETGPAGAKGDTGETGSAGEKGDTGTGLADWTTPGAIGSATPSTGKFTDLQATGTYKDKDGDVGTAGQILSSTNTGTDWIDAPSGGGSDTYAIGLNNDLGGYVFFVTPDGKHGLVAATQNQATGHEWYNAQDVISDPENHDTAGKNFTDWRLPTKYELNLMYDKKADIGAFADNWYWSSTEANSTEAWTQDFADGSQPSKVMNSYRRTRAVRAF